MHSNQFLNNFLFLLQDIVMLNGFGTVVNALGRRVKPYLPQICGTILWRLNNKAAKVRQQAADLISRIANVMKTCQEVGHPLVILFQLLIFNYCSFSKLSSSNPSDCSHPTHATWTPNVSCLLSDVGVTDIKQ